MRYFLFLCISFSLSVQAIDDCENSLEIQLHRGPITLNVRTSELVWGGEEGHQFKVRLVPRRLQVMHALFVAGVGVPEHAAIAEASILEQHARLYPEKPISLATLIGVVQVTNREIILEDEDMTYRLVSGRYRDALTFKWNDRLIQVTEDQFTILTQLSDHPNEVMSRLQLHGWLEKANARWGALEMFDSELSRLVVTLRKEYPELPIENVRGRGYRWVDHSKAEEVLTFRGFNLIPQLSRLWWMDGNQRHELRLKPIECAVLKERFNHGDRRISWPAVAANPNEERLKTASIFALRVHFSNVRKRVLDLTPSAENRFNSK